MAKVTSVNINSAPTGTSDIGYGISGLMTLLLANGWTLVSCGTGTLGARRLTPALSQPEWTAATNTWQIVNRGSIWVAMRRVSATSLDVRYAVQAPTFPPTGNATTPDSFPAGSEQTFLTLSITGANRAHAITYDTDENAAGIRPFYLLFTDGTATLRGTVVLEALANGTYASTNAYPYVVTATTLGNALQGTLANWAWYYSPSSIWVPSNAYTIPCAYDTGSAAYIAQFGGATIVGVDPWNSKDPSFPISFGRRTAQTSPGFVGTAKYIKGAGVLRGYLNTVDTATDAYVYANQCLVPFANNTIPL